MIIEQNQEGYIEELTRLAWCLNKSRMTAPLFILFEQNQEGYIKELTRLAWCLNKSRMTAPLFILFEQNQVAKDFSKIH